MAVAPLQPTIQLHAKSHHKTAKSLPMIFIYLPLILVHFAKAVKILHILKNIGKGCNFCVFGLILAIESNFLRFEIASHKISVAEIKWKARKYSNLR